VKLGFILLGVALVAATSCVGVEPLTPKEIKAGRKVYVAKCAKCHRFYEPKNYTDADWERWMGKMSRKARLKADQEELMKRYLGDYREGKIERAR
jgi:hypothetical protein